MSAPIASREMKLKEIFSRLPRLSGLYSQTYGEPAKSASFNYLRFVDDKDLFEIQFSDPQKFDSRSSLQSIVERWRERFPYLRRWRVSEAQVSWGESFISLMNSPCDVNLEFSEAELSGPVDSRFVLAKDLPNVRVGPESLIGVGGGYTEELYGIEAVDGDYINEFALTYLGAFLLSSLVRYRPDIWAHSISRRSIQNRPLDDRCLALIERFLEQNIDDVSRFVVVALNPYEDRYWSRVRPETLP